MGVIHKPKMPSFTKEGMNGFCYEIESDDISLTIEDSYKGHDKYCTNLKKDVIYYVLEGNGKFKIDGEIVEVQKEDVIEIKANTEFVFAGKMKLLYISVPKYQKGDFQDGKDNDIW